MGISGYFGACLMGFALVYLALLIGEDQESQMAARWARWVRYTHQQRLDEISGGFVQTVMHALFGGQR